MKNKLLVSALGLAVLTSPVTLAADDAELHKQAVEMMQNDFQTRGIATVDRLQQDEAMALCTKYANQPPAEVAKKIEAAAMQTIKYPADGKYMGDWQRGDKLAQSGRGATWSDKPDAANGGSCYNCHRVSGTELSYGTIGTSLYQFGKLRGGPTEANQKYAYGKIYNSQAFVACSNMPRFGHHGVLTEEQIKDLVALLLDPASPVNQ